MPQIAPGESSSHNPNLTNIVTAAIGGKITISIAAAIAAAPNAAVPAGILTNGVSGGNTTDRGLAYEIGLILQQTTSLYRI